MNAMRKIEVQHGHPGYAEADQTHMALRNEVREMIAGAQAQLEEESAATPNLVRATTAAKTQALGLIEKGADLIRDMAVTRDDMPNALGWLKTQVKASGLERIMNAQHGLNG